METYAEALKSALENYPEPFSGKTLREMGATVEVRTPAGAPAVHLTFGFPVGDYDQELQSAVHKYLQGLGVAPLPKVSVASKIVAHAVQRGVQPVAGIKNIVAVASGKGGVGKSTVAANLALAWSRAGARVGLLDADIYGPSVPLLLGLGGEHPNSRDGKRIIPLEAHGLKAMSIGFLVDASQALVWRGPMVTQALVQLLNDTDWGELDYLVIDLPPGTGDIQLTLAQKVAVAGAVIVTTPQDLALADARRGIAMFNKVSVPVLGVVENMSVYHCPQCGHAESIFGAGGGARMAAEHGVRLLGELPLEMAIRTETDSGCPTVQAAPESARALAFRQMARSVAAELALRPRNTSSLFPKVVVEGQR